MKRNFNIFQSYNSGSEKDLESVVQLEDNLTRAFLVTLSNLEGQVQHEIISDLFQIKNLNRNEDFEFDLQNPTSKLTLTGKHKIIATIQRYTSKISKYDFVHDNTTIDVILNNSDNKKRREIKEIIVHAQKDNSALNELAAYGMTDVSSNMLASILNLIGENRADGWINMKNNIVLIEAKIGDNEVSKYQLYRHLSKKNGFGINPVNLQKGDKCKEYSIINLTWDEVYNLFKEIEGRSTINERDKFIIKQFMDYLKMNGEVLDFSIIVDEGIIDKENLKSQFKLFLSRLDKRIEDSSLKLKRYGRSIDYLWDYYGLPNGIGEVSKNPHYSISFGEKDFSIALTISDSVFNRDFFKDKSALIIEKCTEMFLNKTKKQLEQYYIQLLNYKLVDRRLHAQRGESFDTFNLYGRLSEIINNKNSKQVITKSLQNFFEAFPNLIKKSKQFEIGFQIDILQFNKIRKDDAVENQLRAINARLLKNPNDLIEEFYKFIEDTYQLFNNLAQYGREQN